MKTNKLCKLLLALCAISVLIATISCEEEELIFVPSFEITKVGITTAICTADMLNNTDNYIYGFCWSTSPNPKITDSNFQFHFGSYVSEVPCVIKNLLPNTKYYIRTFTTRNDKTVYRDEKTFTTAAFGEVTDVDGNIYNTVKIGNQTWMAQNLMVTKYNDGTAIPNIADNTEWSNTTCGAVCDYDNTSSYSKTHGKLYNWHAVNTGKLCPAGWHVPSTYEWRELENTIETKESIMDATGVYWDDEYSTTPLSNETGFTALPSGTRYEEGHYMLLNNTGFWWSSTMHQNDEFPIQFSLTYYLDTNYYYESKNSGLSIRCVKDQE